MPAEVTPNTEDQALQATPPVGTQQETTPADGQTPPSGEEKSGEHAAPKTALEAATQVMAKGAKEASAKPQEGTQPQPKAEEKKPGEDDDDANLPFKDHPRWKEMSSTNRILKVAQKKNEEAIKELEPRARTTDDLNGWLREQNLGKDDFANMLTIASAIRNDPVKAYDLLRPVMEQLEGVVGVRLPAELEQQVAAGAVTREAAQELVRTRSAAHIAQQKLETVQQRETREREERAQADEQGQMDAVVESLNASEKAWAANDPDAEKLKPLLNDAVLVMGQMNPPRNAEEAKKLFTDALASVKKRASAFLPAPKAKDGILPSGGALTLATKPVPKSSLDAAMSALRGGG